MTSTAHYVEIDLLRGEPRLPIENLPDCDAYVMVSHVEQRPSVGLRPIGLRDRLPEIPIPLRDPIPEVRLDLQTNLDHAYDSGGYEDYVYSGAPEPAMSPEQTSWVRNQLESAGPNVELYPWRRLESPTGDSGQGRFVLAVREAST